MLEKTSSSLEQEILALKPSILRLEDILEVFPLQEFLKFLTLINLT
jgi:hypothetical protein